MSPDGFETKPRLAPTLAVDAYGPALLALYGDDLTGMEATEAQKQAFLLALFQIM